jgi:phage terminase large subunit-like protein
VVRKLCGHESGVPTVDSDQSLSRINLPISPPPLRKEKVCCLIVGLGIKANALIEADEIKENSYP